MKKIFMSVATLAFVAVVVAGATGAFFSDTETSTGNTFTAGAIDLKIDSHTNYNGNECKLVGQVYQWVGNAPYPVPGNACTGTWPIKDLTIEKLFSFDDIKPGDEGENTISIHVIDNDAWVCAAVTNLTDYENGQTEPEALVDSTTGTNQGELSSTMLWKVWRDDGTGGGVAGDNIQNGTEQPLASGNPTNGVLALYDSTTGTGPLTGATTGYLGVAWTLPASSGNETQTDGMTADITFEVVQSRNNAGFVCNPSIQDPPTDGQGSV